MKLTQEANADKFVVTVHSADKSSTKSTAINLLIPVAFSTKLITFLANQSALKSFGNVFDKIYEKSTTLLTNQSASVIADRINCGQFCKFWQHFRPRRPLKRSNWLKVVDLVNKLSAGSSSKCSIPFSLFFLIVPVKFK